MAAAHLGGGGALQYGRTALICAAIYGRADCARLLLDAGADKNAQNKVRASVGCFACRALGVMVLGDWCAKKHAICISVFRY